MAAPHKLLQAPPPILRLTYDEIQALSGRLFLHGVSSILPVDEPKFRAELITASRALRELLLAYERGTGRTLHTVLLCGGF
jgi:hypothetical protein